MRPPRGANPQHLSGPRALRKAVRPLNGRLDAEIELGEDIGPTEAEDQEHLRGPATDSLHAGEVRDDLLVGPSAHARERNLTGIDLRREIPEVAELLPRQAGAAQSGVGRFEQLSRPRVAAAVKAQDAVEYGPGGLPRELLVDDRAEQGVEVPALRSWSKATRTDAFDDAREDVVGALEMND